MAAIRFYLDENVPVAIAEQLKRRHIDVFTVRDLGELGDDDESHLSRATAMGCVLCTHDADFVVLATSGVEHAGIVFGQQEKHTIGDWVRVLSRLHATYQAEDFLNRFQFL
jgi:hypothetical protein